MRAWTLSTVVPVLVAVPLGAGAQQSATLAEARTYTSVPAKLPWKPEVAERFSVPAGFQVSVLASGLGGPRILAVHGNRLYATRRDSGDVVVLDLEPGGTAGPPRKAITDLPRVHGIAFEGNRVYLATVREILVGSPTPSGSFEGVRPIVTDLPEGGQHPNRTIGIGPDRKLYVSIGSTCNQCVETSPESAALVRMNIDGSERGVFARGLRNTIGWGWHPETKTLWGADHGSDHLGNEIPVEEINELAAGGHYGWPFCHGDRTVDSLFAQNPPGSTKNELCPRTVAPTMTLDAHSAPIQMAFYDGRQFPAEYRGDAFVALRGSWNREPPVGYKVVRIRFENGLPVRSEDFLTGLLAADGRGHHGRLAGIAILPDGSLAVSDDTNGIIYRIAYRRAGAGGAP